MVIESSPVCTVKPSALRARLSGETPARRAAASDDDRRSALRGPLVRVLAPARRGGGRVRARLPDVVDDRAVGVVDVDSDADVDVEEEDDEDEREEDEE